MKAIIPAAGFGTRFLPATKSMPKEMLPVAGKPVIQYVVEEAVASGIEDILIVTGRGKRAIEDHFDHSTELEQRLAQDGKEALREQVRAISAMANIHYVRQREPLGLGHAVLCGKRFVGDEPFAVLLGDDIVVDQRPATRSLMDVHEATGKSVISVHKVPRDAISRYGVIDGVPAPGGNGVLRVNDFVEKPAPSEAPSDLAAMGRYVLDAEVMRILERTGPGFGGEIQLTDALARLARDQGLLAWEFRGTRFDAGNPVGFLEANLHLSLQDATLAPGVREALQRISRSVPVSVPKELVR